jgi:hypothetical protein
VTRLRRVAGLVAVAAFFVPAVAHADAVSGEELRALAGRAASDPAALAQLRRVDRVDGRAVAVGAALRGARGRVLAARLRLLARGAGERAGGDPRATARDVLSERRFHRAGVPGPFHGLLERIGRWLRKIPRIVNPLDDVIPGPRAVVWIVLSVLVAGVAAWVARRTLSRRVRGAAAAAASGAPEAEDPRALERRADAAEAAGDLEAALRLRFRAGLLRLGSRGAIEFRPSISTHEVRRALRSPDFDSLAATFDDVVYGGRAAAPGDVGAARERWPRVISAAPRQAVPA